MLSNQPKNEIRGNSHNHLWSIGLCSVSINVNTDIYIS